MASTPLPDPTPADHHNKDLSELARDLQALAGQLRFPPNVLLLEHVAKRLDRIGEDDRRAAELGDQVVSLEDDIAELDEQLAAAGDHSKSQAARIQDLETQLEATARELAQARKVARLDR